MPSSSLSSRFVLLMLVALTTLAVAPAQVVPAATGRHITLTAGAEGSIFQSDFNGNWNASSPYNPISEASSQALYGLGAYVDIGFSRWVQIEAEGRWLRLHQLYGIHQDNYLAGPRLPLYRYKKATVYGKALGGFSEMSFGYGLHGRYTTLAFGGGVDMKLTKRLSLRALDVEYQYWPTWGNQTLSPYGASVGLGYKIF